MKHFQGNRLTAIAAVLLAALWILAWSLGLFLVDGQPWSVRAGLLLTGLVVAAFSSVLGLRWLKAERTAVARHFEALCQLEAADLQHAGGLDNVPPLAGNSRWHAVAARVRETLVELSRQLQEVRQAQTALEIRSRRATQQCEQIKTIIAGLSDPIIAVNDFEELLLANTAAAALFEFDGENTEKRAISQLVRCQKLVELLESTCHRKTLANRSDEIEITDGQGRSQWYRASAATLGAKRDAADRQAPGGGGAVVVLRDIGDQKALQKRNAEFVSAVSHEMKTPLAGIKAYVELLVDGDAEDDQTREEFLEVINSQTDRLQRLVDNMLNLARIEAGVVNVNKRSRSLNELLEEALGVVQPAAEAKQIELAAKLSPLYLGVLADRDMLLQAAINLLSNAVKYTPQGGRVTLRSRLVDDEVTFEVEDTGVGLSEEDCQRVFDKFYRVKKDKNMASGTGLGLPLAKHIVEDVHGGHLTLKSVLGQGSTFTATLPKA